MRTSVLIAAALLGTGVVDGFAQVATVPTAMAAPLASRPAGEEVIRVATCQFEVTGEIKANADWIRKQMRTAAQQGADIVHFCECALPGYPGADYPTLQNMDWGLLRHETQTILDLAGELKVWVVLGSIHRLTDDHKPHNSLYVISPQGRVVDRYDKRFCTRADLRHFTPGDHFTTFQVRGVNCGLLICFDLGYPELYREYAKLGTQVILHSFYNARGKRYHLERARLTRVTGPGHAVVNNLFLSLANTAGPMSWGSFVVAPDAEVLASLPDQQAGVVVTTIDPHEPRYDFTLPFRSLALQGVLHSGAVVQDGRSADRTSY
jgi:predicted amidohydrolase